MSGTSSPDWFARTTALIAISLTLVSLYFTYRNYNWQTKESLEERVSVNGGFEYNVKKTYGEVTVYLVNIGMHPIYIEDVSIEVPCDSTAPQISGGCQTCTVECGVGFFSRPPRSNKPFKPLEPGDQAIYTIDVWDFKKYPLHEWMKTERLEDKLWVDVRTTKNSFKQHPTGFAKTIVNADGKKQFYL